MGPPVGGGDAEEVAEASEGGGEDELRGAFADSLGSELAEDEAWDAAVRETDVSGSEEAQAKALVAEGAVELVVVGLGVGEGAEDEDAGDQSDEWLVVVVALAEKAAAESGGERGDRGCRAQRRVPYLCVEWGREPVVGGRV